MTGTVANSLMKSVTRSVGFFPPVRHGSMHVGIAGNVYSVRRILYPLQQWRLWWVWGHSCWGTCELQVLFGLEVLVTFAISTTILITGLLSRLLYVLECTQTWSEWIGNIYNWEHSKLMYVTGFSKFFKLLICVIDIIEWDVYVQAAPHVMHCIPRNSTMYQIDIINFHFWGPIFKLVNLE
jgi:hypothetical protein